MNTIFKEEIGDVLEVYMNDNIVKSNWKHLHENHLNKHET